MILYVENPTESKKTLLELISELSKVAVHKINKQKSIVFQYTKNKHVETKLKNTITFIITSKKIKYLGILLTKHVQDLYDERKS